ncbi:MAG: DUF2157 domain-containing protein [Bacteroidales bacterium]|nr:DUF2157 domain-containing protein [Bacteroidales bacterium]
MSITKDISELVSAGIISQETADKIKNFYRNKGGQFRNRLFVVFGVLGAILVGLGIILILAHNWDDFSILTKTILAFIPLVAGQALCGFALIKKQDSITWRESSTAFLFFAVGSCISLISQIYNISGNMSTFLLTWMLLCFPLIYLMKSSIASLLYIIGITYYAGETCYWSFPTSESYFYWMLLILVLPHYYILFKKKPESNFMIFHNWLVPLSLVITLGTLVDKTGELMNIAYMSLFGLLYLIGNANFFKEQKLINNGYTILGSLGTIWLLLMLSFDFFWKELAKKNFQFSEVISSPELIAAVVISLLAAIILYMQRKNKPFTDVEPIEPIFILFIFTFLIGLFSPFTSIVLVNLLVFSIGIMTIRNGAKLDHLGVLNFGLIIITALVICRFFDTNLSFIIRGILFISVGIGFFIANFRMLKKRKENE